MRVIWLSNGKSIEGDRLPQANEQRRFVAACNEAAVSFDWQEREVH